MSTALLNHFSTTPTTPTPTSATSTTSITTTTSTTELGTITKEEHPVTQDTDKRTASASPRSTLVEGSASAITSTTPTIVVESLTMPSMISLHDGVISNDNNNNNNGVVGTGPSQSNMNMDMSMNMNMNMNLDFTPSSSHNSTVDTVNTISTNNTLNSLNHNTPVSSNTNNTANNNNHNNSNNNNEGIPDGYSVHIKASSNSNNSNPNNINNNNLVKQSSAITSSSISSSPTPTVAPTSTSSSSSSSFNPSLPNISSSSESLSTFNIFEGLNNFPLIGGSTGVGGVTGSSFANALFNTNPLPTPTPSVNTVGVVGDMTSNNTGTGTNIVTDETVAQIVSNTSVPEFLYQLTKMLTDDHRDIIEWSSGKIEVHNPTKLEKEVLNQYFRHSKYASFQRQLNYFGFRKLAGKGKMAPCSYVNENATSDLRSLLRMKRKTSANTKDGKNTSSDNADSSTTQGTKGSHGRSNNKKSSSNKRARTSHRQHHHTTLTTPRHPHTDNISSSSSITIAKGSGVKHQLNGYLAGNSNNARSSSNTAVANTALTYNANNSILPSSTTSSSSSQITPINNPLVPDPMSSLDPLSIAKAAVGKGVTHQYSASLSSSQHHHNQVNNPTTSTNNRNTSSSNIGGMGIGQSIISGMPTDSCNKLTFLEPSQLGMGLESCLSELQTNFQNSLNEANANNNVNDGMNNISSGTNTNFSANDNNNNDNNNNLNNNGGTACDSNNNDINNQYNNTSQLQLQPTMQRESSLVDLAIIPSLSSTLPQSTTNNGMALDNSLTSNSKSLENDYGMTFIDFPIGGLPPPED